MREIFFLTWKLSCSIILFVFSEYMICDSGVVGNARPCQGRDRGFEPRLSLFLLTAESVCSAVLYPTMTLLLQSVNAIHN